MTALKRYYLDSGDTNPEAKTATADLSTTVHALYTHWVQAGYHRRDFVSALAHAADCIFIDFKMSGAPSLKAEDLPLLTVPLAQPRKGRIASTQLRFYDELDDINPDVDCAKHVPALGPHFVRWVAAGFAPRDFTQAVRDLAGVVIYDHQLCESFGGMGGGKTGEQFLTSTYKA